MTGMSLERARRHLARYGLAEAIIETSASSATVELAARAVGTEPARIAKTLSFLLPGDLPILIVVAGDARLDNRKYKDEFATKARMIPGERVEQLVGHAVGGVCPFGVTPGVAVYLDESLRRFDVVFPACGNSNSAVRLTLAELERAADPVSWVDVSTV